MRALRDAVHADLPELARVPFLAVAAAHDCAVHLHLDEMEDPGSGKSRSFAMVAELSRREGRWTRAFPSVPTHGIGIDLSLERSELLARLVRHATDELPPPLQRSSAFVPSGKRPARTVARPLAQPLLEAAQCAGLDVGPLEAAVGTLPPDYVRYARRYGDAMVNGFVRVYGPERVLKDLSEHRQLMRWYFHWRHTEDSVDRQLLVESVPLADTLEGDVFVVHPDQPSEVILLPRDADSVETFAGFWTAVHTVVERRALGAESVVWLEPRRGIERRKAFPATPEAAGLDAVRELLEWLTADGILSTMSQGGEASWMRFLPAQETWLELYWPEDDPDDAKLMLWRGASGADLVERVLAALTDYGWRAEVG